MFGKREKVGTADVHSTVWGARARDWAEVQEGMVAPLYEAVFRTTPMGGEMHLLDIGCGAGLFCQLAAQRGVQVSGLDATPELLAIAQTRTPQGDFRQGEMEALPYAAQSFDLVTGFNSFQFATNPVNALRQARRVARQGALVVIATWGKPEAAETVKCMATLSTLLSLPSPGPNGPGPFTLSQPGVLEAVVREAGLTPINEETVDCLWVYPDEATALRGMLAAGPVTRAIQVMGKAAVREACAQAILSAKRADGSYQMKNQFRYLLTSP